MKIRRASATPAPGTSDDPADGAATVGEPDARKSKDVKGIKPSQQAKRSRDPGGAGEPGDSEDEASGDADSEEAEGPEEAEEEEDGSGSLAALIRQGVSLKRDLAAFARGGRFARWRDPYIARILYGTATVARPSAFPEPSARDFLRVLDDFVMTFRFPDGTDMIGKFLESRDAGLSRENTLSPENTRSPENTLSRANTLSRTNTLSRENALSPDDVRLLKSWRESLDGIFEVSDRDDETGELLLRNLIDDLEYRAYLSPDPAKIRTVQRSGFVFARLAPLRAAGEASMEEVLDGEAGDTWLVSGPMHSYPRSAAGAVARTALAMARQFPSRVFRNPALADEGRAAQRAERDTFIGFFGEEEVVLEAGEAQARVSAFYRRARSAPVPARRGRALPGRWLKRRDPDPGAAGFQAPAEWESAETIGVIYDETHGLAFLPDYGLVRDLFADPSLAADKRHAAALKAYLDDDTVPPFVLTRLAEAYPDGVAGVDEVYRKVLKRGSFTWEKNGEALLRKHKPAHYAGEPLPSVTVLGSRLRDLLDR